MYKDKIKYYQDNDAKFDSVKRFYEMLNVFTYF